MITAPSTIRPKSSAPRLIRLPLMPALHHADGGQQHRERDHQRGDQRRAEVAEQQEQHDDDEQRAFGEVLRDRRDRRVDQLRAVEHGLDRDARRQRSADLLHLARRPPRRPCGCSRRSASAPCRRRPRRRSRWRCRCAVSPPIADVGDVADAHRHAAARADDDVADLLDVLDPAAGAHDDSPRPCARCSRRRG